MKLDIFIYFHTDFLYNAVSMYNYVLMYEIIHRYPIRT